MKRPLRRLDKRVENIDRRVTKLETGAEDALELIKMQSAIIGKQIEQAGSLGKMLERVAQYIVDPNGRK